MQVHPEAGMPPFTMTGPWAWREPSHGEHYRTCSFCGSIHPDDLAAEDDWRAQWADQKYGWPHKMYVDVVNRDPGALFVTAATTHLRPGDEDRFVAAELLTEQQRAIVERDGWGAAGGEYAGYLFAPRAKHHVKFYSVHLADAGVSEQTRAAICERSGVAFTFTEDRKVQWRPFHHIEP